MKTRIATAILIGTLVPDLRAGELQVKPRTAATPQRIREQVVTRRGSFEQLPSAGRFGRAEVATFAIEEGRLLAEWTGSAKVDEPSRLEMADLDAEWMAHTPASPIHDGTLDGRFLLARRDLAPDDQGRFFDIHLFGNRAAAGQMQIMVTVHEAGNVGDATNINYIQSDGPVKATVSGRLFGLPTDEIAVEAGDLKLLMEQNPIIRKYFEPALKKLARLEV